MVADVSYIELQSDHEQTAFLAALTPSRVLRDRELTFSPQERKRQKFLRSKAAVEQEVLAVRRGQFSREQIERAQLELDQMKENK